LVRHYHSQLDAIHKMWGYLALVGAAAIAAAWAYSATTSALVWIALCAFAIYATGNGLAVYFYQCDLEVTSKAVRDRCATQRASVGPFASVLGQTVSTTAPVVVAAVHAVVDFAVVFAVASRLLWPPAPEVKQVRLVRAAPIEKMVGIKETATTAADESFGAWR